MRQLLHLARAERGRVSEYRELIATKRPRRENIDKDERSFPEHPEIVPRSQARAKRDLLTGESMRQSMRWLTHC